MANVKKLFFDFLSIIASIIGIFVFLTGYVEIGQILPDFSRIPLFKTLLTNRGWVNLIIFICVVGFVEYLINKNKREHLRNIIALESSKWNKENNSLKILRELKTIARSHDGASSFVIVLVGLFFCMCVYHSNLINKHPNRCVLDIGTQRLMCEHNKTLSNEETVVLLAENGKILTSNDNENSLIRSISPFPDSNISNQENSASIMNIKYPKYNTVTIDNGWLFIVYCFIFYAALQSLVDDRYKLTYLLSIKKLKYTKYTSLLSLIEKHNFRQGDNSFTDFKKYLKNYLENKIKHSTVDTIQ